MTGKEEHAMRRTTRREGERGFSMAELMVALAITLIIGTAIVALVSSGSKSFRREPAVSDRQQNIRLALDLITRDVVAGTGFLTADGIGPTGPTGTATDAIFMFRPSESCPDVPSDSAFGANISAPYALPGCYTNDSFVFVFYSDGHVELGWGHNIHAGNPPSSINFPPGQGPSGINSVLTVNDTVTRMGHGDFVKWQIANDADGTPSLWRTDSGGYDSGWNLVNTPTAPTWQLVARGVEDMQIKYRLQGNYSATDPNAGWTDTPTGGGSATNNLVRQVRVTLQARTVGQVSLQGQTTVASGPAAIRGQLTSVITPPYTLLQLSQQTPPLYQ